MPDLRFLSERPNGKIAEIQALMRWPKDENIEQRDNYQANFLKKYYIKSLVDIIEKPDDASPDDAERGILASILVFDAELYNYLGGIEKIMNSVPISEEENEKFKHKDRLIGLTMYLLYCGLNFPALFKPHKLTCQSNVLKHICLRNNQGLYNNILSEKTIHKYMLDRPEVLHFIVAKFIYNEMRRIINQKGSKWESDEKFKMHYNEYRYEYFVGYAKTIFDWGKAKTVNQRPQPIIDTRIAFDLPNDVKSIDLPSVLTEYYSELVSNAAIIPGKR